MALSQNKEKRKKQLANLKPCKPGETRNPGGRPKTKFISEALRAALASGDAEILAKVLLKLGKKGQIAAIREIADRTEGKSKETVEHTGEGGGPITHTIRFGDGKRDTK